MLFVEAIEVSRLVHGKQALNHYYELSATVYRFVQRLCLTSPEEEKGRESQAEGTAWRL